MKLRIVKRKNGLYSVQRRHHWFSWYDVVAYYGLRKIDEEYNQYSLETAYKVYDKELNDWNIDHNKKIIQVVPRNEK